MKLVVVPFVVFILIINVIELHGQYIPDAKFDWKKIGQCTAKGVCEEVYLKVEQDPRITQFDQNQFYDYISLHIGKLDLANSSNGVLKLKLNFSVGRPLCLQKLGLFTMTMTDSQVEILHEAIRSISQIEYGKQRGQMVSCIGILYLTIQEGKLVTIRNVNFNFKQ